MTKPLPGRESHALSRRQCNSRTAHASPHANPHGSTSLETPLPPRDDEYDLSYVYESSATNNDIAKRHIEPLVKKMVDGYNATIITFGASGEHI
jgi:hypothetical protein